MLRNEKTDREGTVISVFDLEVDIGKCTARLPENKLGKAVDHTGKMLRRSSASFPDVQSLV